MAKHLEGKVNGLKAMSHHIVNKVPSGEAAAWHQLFGRITTLAEGAEALHNLFSARDPGDTDSGHFKKVSTAAARFKADIEKAGDKVETILFDGRREIDGRITAKLRLTPDKYEREIRDVWRTMKSDEQIKYVGQLINENRGPELAALLLVPSFLTGLSALQRDQFEGAFVSKHAPKELEERDNLTEAYSNLQTAMKVATEVADGYTDHRILAEVTRATNAANDAAKKFNAVVGQ